MLKYKRNTTETPAKTAPGAHRRGRRWRLATPARYPACFRSHQNTEKKMERSSR